MKRHNFGGKLESTKQQELPTIREVVGHDAFYQWKLHLLRNGYCMNLFRPKRATMRNRIASKKTQHSHFLGNITSSAPITVSKSNTKVMNKTLSSNVALFRMEIETSKRNISALTQLPLSCFATVRSLNSQPSLNLSCLPYTSQQYT